MDTARPYWNPYVAGVGLGLTLVLAYAVLGTGLGASGGIARVAAAGAHAVAPAVIERNDYLAPWFEDGGPLRYYLVAMLVGTFAGGFVSALAAGRLRPRIEHGPHAGARVRLVYALLGGAIAGIGARFASGCTSGLALSGGALLQAGAFVFTAATFFAAFAFAPLVRQEWR